MLFYVPPRCTQFIHNSHLPASYPNNHSVYDRVHSLESEHGRPPNESHILLNKTKYLYDTFSAAQEKQTFAIGCHVDARGSSHYTLRRQADQ